MFYFYVEDLFLVIINILTQDFNGEYNVYNKEVYAVVNLEQQK